MTGEDEAVWSLSDGTVISTEDTFIGETTVINTGATTVDGAGSFAMNDPFGDQVVTALEFTSVDNGATGNNSDFTILAIEALEPLNPFVTAEISLLTEEELGGGGGGSGPKVIPNPEPATIVIWSLLAALGLVFHRRRNR